MKKMGKGNNVDHKMKAALTPITTLMVAAAAFMILFSFSHQSVLVAAQVPDSCNPTTINTQLRNITFRCVLSAFRTPSEEASGVPPPPVKPCCDAAAPFNFSCSCSSTVLNFGIGNVNGARILNNTAGICNITLPRGLNCTGLVT